ncbi:hypothetical protein BIW11_11763 [Tropilaelaps mercedesae]|uniref:TGF-beta family profile domain-containing protein n=1 Tax=Tropilaelaps mercedesae TaxID=418985 RepID=A0A1V9XA83_9ACAR|nr:hypothetical protein BIW11_11763 [Tropilaelaps mercedesae]
MCLTRPNSTYSHSCTGPTLPQVDTLNTDQGDLVRNCGAASFLSEDAMQQHRLSATNPSRTGEGPSDMAHWQPNGHRIFQFFFPQIARLRSSDQIVVAKSTILYLRLKSPGGWRLQKLSTPSSSQTAATPNDVDTENISLNMDSATLSSVIINITEPGCRNIICRTSVEVDLSSTYPYAKINLRLFGLRWLTTTERETQRIEISVMSRQSREPLNIGDYFVGMRCDTSEPRLSLPGALGNDASKLDYLEGLADSFLSIDYAVRSSFSTNTDRAFISHTGFSLRDFQSSGRRARFAPSMPRTHHHHRGHPGRLGSGGTHRTHHLVETPLALAADSVDDGVTVAPSALQRDSHLRCDKQQEYMTFVDAGMRSVIEPAGFNFVSCKCTRICSPDESPCLPCESRVLASLTLTVKERVDGEILTRQRTIPTDCGCY